MQVLGHDNYMGMHGFVGDESHGFRCTLCRKSPQSLPFLLEHARSVCHRNWLAYYYPCISEKGIVLLDEPEIVALAPGGSSGAGLAAPGLPRGVLGSVSAPGGSSGSGEAAGLDDRMRADLRDCLALLDLPRLE